MKLIAKKPCSFGGKRFYIGDEIPLDLVQEPRTQEKFGLLTIVSTDEVTPEPSDEATAVPVPASTLTISVSVNGEEMDLEPTFDDLQNIFRALSGNTDTATAIIDQMTNNDALILLHLADKRVTVQKAAKARGEELQESAGEQ